jgi:hypothetical protein
MTDPRGGGTNAAQNLAIDTRGMVMARPTSTGQKRVVETRRGLYPVAKPSFLGSHGSPDQAIPARTHDEQ